MGQNRNALLAPPEGVSAPGWLDEAVTQFLEDRGRKRPRKPHKVILATFQARLGAVIGAARAQRDRMTQTALAGAMSDLLRDEVDQPFISRMEDLCATSFDRFEALAVALRLPPSALVRAAEASFLI